MTSPIYHNPDNLPSPGEGWRFLNEGEEPQEGDEQWNACSERWKPFATWTLGTKSIRSYRRPLPPESREGGEGWWQPMLVVSKIQISYYAGDTLEFRDRQQVFLHFTKEETAAFLDWIDARPHRRPSPPPKGKGQRFQVAGCSLWDTVERQTVARCPDHAAASRLAEMLNQTSL